MELSIFNAIHDLAGQSRLLDFLGVFFADYSGYVLILAAVVIIAMENDWRKRFLNASLAALSLIISRGLITEIIRVFYNRPRPFLALGFDPLVAQINHGAFPSGHAAFYFALAGVIWLLDRSWGRRFFFAAFLIGLARIFVGVHWPSDILGGALVGVASVWFARSILKL